MQRTEREHKQLRENKSLWEILEQQRRDLFDEFCRCKTMWTALRVWRECKVLAKFVDSLTFTIQEQEPEHDATATDNSAGRG